MSSSDRLRESHSSFGGGKVITSEKSTKQESTVRQASNIILERLRNEYPDREFDFRSRVPLREFRKPELDNTFFSPDGGFIYENRRNEDGTTSKFYVLITEAKHQGTNDKRQDEGFKKQAKGNAIERAAKNFVEVLRLTEKDKRINNPFVIFCSGCDFEDGSSIRDRITGICGVPNVIITDKLYGSIFMRTERYSVEEIVDIGYAIAVESLRSPPEA